MSHAHYFNLTVIDVIGGCIRTQVSAQNLTTAIETLNDWSQRGRRNFSADDPRANMRNYLPLVRGFIFDTGEQILYEYDFAQDGTARFATRYENCGRRVTHSNR